MNHARQTKVRRTYQTIHEITRNNTNKLRISHTPRPSCSCNLLLQPDATFDSHESGIRVKAIKNWLNVHQYEVRLPFFLCLLQPGHRLLIISKASADQSEI